jgi:predicted nucleic acid-binding protein
LIHPSKTMTPAAKFDAWIAATAIRHDLPLGTNNRRHFEGVSGLAPSMPSLGESDSGATDRRTR